MSNFVPSVYQSDIFKYIKESNNNLVINAVAGSGKTTTIIHALNFIDINKKIIFLAFNKDIVENIKTKVPNNTKVQTFHSLGCGAIYKAYRDSKMNKDKIYNIINNNAFRWAITNKNVNDDYKQRVKTIVDLTRLSLATDVIDIQALCEKHQILALNDEIEKALSVIEEANNDISQFDYTDMIYWPAKFQHIGKNIPKYDFVFVDECQDLNKAQHHLIELMSHQNTRTISVGDRNQAIYGFAGADSESFDNLLNRPNTTSLPLSVSYRCGKNIVSLAKRIVPQIEHKLNAHDGIVDYNASYNKIHDGDMVLCRITAPLVTLCLEYLKTNRKAYVKGANIGEDLIRLIYRSGKYKVPELMAWLEFELHKIFLILKQKYPKLDDAALKERNAYVNFEEKIDIINSIVNNDRITITNILVEKIKSIFLDTGSGICLSTIHRAKGLESNNVFILCKNLMPSKYAKLPWEHIQEENLEYVAYSRAKNYLGFISDWPVTKPNN